MKRIFIFIFSIHLLSQAMSAQDIKVTAAFDTSKIFIGDQIHYTVTIEKPAGYIVTSPVLKDSLESKIEILSGPISDTTVLSNGFTRIVHKYLVTCFDSGFYNVKPYFAEIVGNNQVKRFYSDYTPLEVTRVNITPADTSSAIFDIVGPYKAPITVGEILPWVLAAIVLAAAIWLAIKLVRKLRKSKGEIIEKTILEPAHVIAFRELEKLNAEQLWQKGDTKLYYSRLTDILRQYIENRYAVPSLELTTAETLYNLQKAGVPNDDSLKILRNLLTGADLVKFAKYVPENSENEDSFQNSIKYVDETKMIETAIESATEIKEGKEEGR
ncbi:MAG: hypothetical protein U0X39_02085 [Bacteroidales bacterium]